MFSVIGALAVYAIQRLQTALPLNPAGEGPVESTLAMNTAVSFVTNTNWQAYGGESTMSYLTQMVALTVQNFVSAATGIAVMVAVIRGFRGRQTDKIGNFWVDLTRATVYILLPLSILMALVMVQQGMPQTFDNYRVASLTQPIVDSNGKAVTTQTLALGPVASQVSIKQLGTNGGGFFNANSAHPYENPTPFTNFLECLAILLIPAALCCTFGEMVKDRRQGWAIFAAMAVIFVIYLIPCVAAELAGNPSFHHMGLSTASNWEGKEVRIGVGNSALWATATTAASNGSVNAMHDSFTPLGGLVPLFLMNLGEVIFGGVGSGLYGMLMFAVVTVFIAGLMVGRTPEYLGKKIEAFEMKMAAIFILIPCCLVKLGSALAIIVNQSGIHDPSNPGAHGFSRLLYAYSSMAENNGSAFAAFNANLPYHNIAGAIIMWISRFWLVIPVLALAGSLAKKKVVPAGAGTLPTDNALFVVLLIAVVFLVGALTIIPALALGPVVEHLQMVGGAK
jgi:K+-transporting ATPase ATPase A chain